MAAAGRAGKKVLKQDELRRLMREKQRQAAPSKRIEHPFAKYPYWSVVVVGQLLCTLCSAPIKNEALWQTHVLGRQHKEVSSWRDLFKHCRCLCLLFDFVLACSKVLCTHLGLGGPKNESHCMIKFLHIICLPTLLLIFHCGYLLAPKKFPKLPCFLLDFFDGGSVQTPPPVQHSGSVEKAADQDEKTIDRYDVLQNDLFIVLKSCWPFDVRKVDLPKDQMEKEWEEFQKEMWQQNTVSDAIVAVEDEEGRVERRIDEIDEQIQLYRRVESLRDRQDGLKDVPLEGSRTGATDNDDDDQDEAELQSFLSGDWRAKGALL
uniref:Zinc finger protein 830 n=1 Tax=Eptatretus burgeri TaxID=7764 RepID=A0A8C4NIK8_EPTBU